MLVTDCFLQINQSKCIHLLKVDDLGIFYAY